MDIWVVFTTWLSWIMLLWAFMDTFLCEQMSSILGRTVTLCLTFLGTARLFSTVAAPLQTPTSNEWGWPLHLIEHQEFSSLFNQEAWLAMSWVSLNKWMTVLMIFCISEHCTPPGSQVPSRTNVPRCSLDRSSPAAKCRHVISAPTTDGKASSVTEHMLYLLISSRTSENDKP